MYTIVGNGAVASLLTAALFQHKLKYQVILKPEHKASFYQLACLNAKQLKVPLPRYDFKEKIDFLILPIKAYQVENTLKQLKNQLEPNATLVLLHNGMGTEEIVNELLPNARVILATTTHGAYKPQLNQVNQTGLGETYFGSTTEQTANQKLNELINAWQPAYWSQDISQKLWLKLAINTAINPLTAIYQVKNGELLKADWRNQLIDIAYEINQAALAKSIHLTQNDILEQILTVADKTKDNFSSMNRDVFYKRKTEIDFINGYLLNIAAENQLQLPTIETLYNKVKALEVETL
ncbi:ketopantoate reductase family protein [Catenovulum maritimum]|uniref:ketopantoate reductase family protein n=1 Tax=Catenovulum maritimum TaxID=1513271 RepID=UPI00097BD72D|nr:2-dehydropantoate 2-reductase [Catenovulum maritimum]